MSLPEILPKICENCDFYVAVSNVKGECHLSPASIQRRAVPDQWPLVPYDGFCSHHRRDFSAALFTSYPIVANCVTVELETSDVTTAIPLNSAGRVPNHVLMIAEALTIVMLDRSPFDGPTPIGIPIIPGQYFPLHVAGATSIIHRAYRTTGQNEVISFMPLEDQGERGSAAAAQV